MSATLVIIGASAMGRETYTYAREVGMEVKGFLDSRAEILRDYVGYPSVICPVEDYVITPGDVFICAVGDPAMRMKYAEIIALKGGRFVSIIHPQAYIGQNVRIGHGGIIAPHTTITNDTVLGDHVIVNLDTSVSHDNKIGDFSSISPGCHLAGRVRLGERVFLGVGVNIIPDVVLGDDVYVAAGSVVTKSFPKGRVMGVPACSK